MDDQGDEVSTSLLFDGDIIVLIRVPVFDLAHIQLVPQKSVPAPVVTTDRR